MHGSVVETKVNKIWKRVIKLNMSS